MKYLIPNRIVAAFVVGFLFIGVHSPALEPSVCIRPNHMRQSAVPAADLSFLTDAKKRANHFMSSIGYSDFKSTIFKLSREATPEGRATAKLLKMYSEGYYTFAMDRSHSTRAQILKSGRFLNQHEINTSSGAYDPVKRSAVEAAYLNLSAEAYSKIPNVAKPKSTYLYPVPSSQIMAQPTHYISKHSDVFDKSIPDSEAFLEVPEGDTWVYDLEKIKKETLFVVGDSLDRAGFVQNFFDGPDFSLNPSASMDPTSLVSYQLPLEFLPSSLPYFLDEVMKSNTFRTVDDTSLKTPYYLALNKRVASEEAAAESEGAPLTTGLRTFYQNRFNNRMPNVTFQPTTLARYPVLESWLRDHQFEPFGRYVEGLVYGPLGLSQVKYFIYRAHPPTSEEKQILKQHGIIICKNDLKNCEK